MIHLWLEFHLALKFGFCERNYSSLLGEDDVEEHFLQVGN